MKNNLAFKLVIATSLATTIGLGGATTASAVGTPPALVTAAETSTHTSVNAACLAELRGNAAVSKNECTTTVVAEASTARRATAADLAASQSSMSASDFASLTEAAATTAVYAKSYSQTEYQISDTERQYGTFYYNGSHVWVASTYLGYRGTHYCTVPYAVGYSISNNACSDSGSTTTRALTMIWNIAVGLIPRGPISWTESWTMYVQANGAISQ